MIQPPIAIHQRRSSHVARRELQRAAREANRGNRPPETHLLLRDARSALARTMYRWCILDAAIAVEVMASSLLDQLLDQAIGQPTRKALDLDRAYIPKKIAILRSLGVSLPADLQRALFTVRNKVIHHGKQASQDEARKALDAATAAVTANLAI